MSRRIIALAAIALTVTGIVVGLITGFSSPASSQTPVNPAGEVFIISPTKETFFYIKDESRGRAVTYICGFIHNFVPNGFGGVTPSVQCNKI